MRFPSTSNLLNAVNGAIPTLASGQDSSSENNEKERSSSPLEGDNVIAAADERGQGNRYPTRRQYRDGSDFYRRCSQRDGEMTSLRRESSSRIKVCVARG